MIDVYELSKDFVVPGVTGLGAVVVGIASLRVARASNILAKSVSDREHERLQLLDREAYAESLRQHVSTLRRLRLVRGAQMTLEEREASLLLTAGSNGSGLPYIDVLVRAVHRQMAEEWVTSDEVEGAMHATIEAHGIIQIWVRDPAAFLDLERGKPEWPPGP